MLRMNAGKNRGRLYLSASALVVAFCCLGANAQAQTVLTSGNTPWVMNGDTTVEELVVQSGDTAYVTADYNSIPSGYLGIVWSGSPSTSSTGSCSFGGCYATADTITVEDGATIIITNPWGWQPFQSIFNVEGDAIFQAASWGGGQTILMGTSTFLGNITLEDGFWGSTNNLQIGQSWGTASVVFGEDTNIILGDSTLLEMWLGSSSATMGGSITGSGNVTLYSGTLTVNGAATAADPFTGAFTLGAGATLVVGDADHADAVFGDPNASAATITIQASGSSLGVLRGYGTIYGTVTNGSIVKPGGTSGVLGSLTIVGDYIQSSTGQLKVEIAPTGASSLIVNGDATLDGSLIITIDDGEYGNTVYQVLSADSITGEFSTVSTSGSVSGAIVGMTSDDTGIYLVTEKASSAQMFGHIVTATRTNLYNFAHSLYDVIDMGAPASGSKKTAAGGEYRIWATPFGSVDNISRDGLGYNNTTYGVTVGAEYRTPWQNAVAGLAVSYGSGSMDVKGEDTSVDSSTYNVAVYGGADILYGRVDGMFFYNVFDATAERKFSGYGTAKSTPSGWAWGGSLQVSRNLFDNLVTPYVRGIFARVSLNAETETGLDLFDLAYDGIEKATFVADAGVRVHLLKPTPDLKAKLELTLAVQHDFSDRGEMVTGGFAELSGSSFSYTWKGNSENALLVGLNFADEVADGVEVYGRVNGMFTTQQRAADFQIGAKYRF